MSFGTLNPKQARVVSRLVRGRRVLDLGAGDLEIAVALVRLGALGIAAIDTLDMRRAWALEHGLAPVPLVIHPIQRAIAGLAGGPRFHCDIAMLSWPSPQGLPGLVPLLDEMPYVVYLGKNTRGVNRYGDEESPWCGDEALWQHLITRNVVAHVPDPVNTLTVYGPRRGTRTWTGEELAALTNRKRRSTWGFAEAEKEAKAGRMSP